MNSLTNGMSEVKARYLKPTFEYFNLHESLQRVLALSNAESQKNLTIDRDYDPSIPEINGDIVENLKEPTLIANPNCSTSQLLMVLKPIHERYGIEFLNIATYQAVSGTGKEAVEELRSQTYDNDSIESKVYPKLHKVIGPTALCQVMQFYFTLSLQEYSKCQDSLVHTL